MRFESVRVELGGAHYQPEGCNQAIVTGIFWDCENKRMAVSLAYDSGITDVVPLMEIGRSHPLGYITVLNESARPPAEK